MKHKKSKVKLGLWILALLATAAVIVYMVIPKSVMIKTVQVQEGILRLSLSSTGVVEGELSDVSPQVTARVARLFAQENENVEKGQLLSQLEDADALAEVQRLQASVKAAGNDADALNRTAISQAGQLTAGVRRAEANLKSARDRLRELQAGTRIEEIDAQKAVVRQARADAEDARKRLDRAKQLFIDGALAAQDRDTAQTRYDAAAATLDAQEQRLKQLERGPRREIIAAAKSEVEAADATYSEAKSALGLAGAKRKEAAAALARLDQTRADLKKALVQLGYTSIVSPVRGVVVRKHKEVGEIAVPLDPIYTVANMDNIWVTAEVDEEDAAAIARGQIVTITLDAYPGREIKGRVIRVSPIAEPKEVGRVRAKIVRAKIVPESTSIPLRPGMEVNVNGSISAQRQTLLVPNDAVIRVGDVDKVFVVEDGVAHARKVEMGQSNFDFTQIISGLKSGEAVAVTDLDKLSDGVRVGRKE